MIHLNKNIKFLRNQKNISQTQLGKEINLTRDSIASLEQGRVKPSFEILISLKEYFNISLDDLVFKNLTEKDDD